MSSRNNLFSVMAAAIVLTLLLAGCIAGTTVRQSASSSGSPSPTPSPSATGSATPVPSPSGSPGAPGTQLILDTGRTNIYDVCQDSVNLYYTIKVAGNSSVMAVPKDGSSAPIVLASGIVTLAWGVDCDPGSTGFVYFTDNLPTPQGTVWRVSKPVNGVAQGTPQMLGTGLNSPTFIRLNNVTGGDGLLYTCENVISSGRVLRYQTATPNQSSTTTAFITDTDNTPPYNLRLFNVNGLNQLWYTLMSSDLTTGPAGEIRFINTSAAPGPHTNTTQVGAGILNPTDLTVDPFGLNVYWTQYDVSLGSVNFCKVNQTMQSGTTVGNSGPASIIPPAAILGIFSPGIDPILLVTRNAQEANGGGVYEINVTTNQTTELLVNVGGTQEGGTNFPFQMVFDLTSLYVTEFNFSQGANGLATQPSRLVRLTPLTEP